MDGRRCALRCDAVVLALLLVLALPPGAALAQSPEVKLRVTGYFSTLTGRQGGTDFARGNASMYGLTLTVNSRRTPWGGGLEYITGSLRNGEGIWAGMQSGDTRFVNAWASYNLLHGRQTDTRLDVFAGWNKNRWQVTNVAGFRETFRADGFMIGASTYVPLGGGFEFWGRAAYVPGANVSLENGIGATSTGNIFDWAAALSYEHGPWLASLGYRVKKDRANNNVRCPDCEFGWRGVTLGVQYSF
jgi:hypothetical protein